MRIKQYCRGQLDLYVGSVCVGTAGLCGHTWNGGSCCFSLEDDTSFLLDVIQTVRDSLPSTFATKVFMVGFSAGGVMSHRMACSHPEVFAAAVSVSGSNDQKQPVVNTYIQVP